MAYSANEDRQMTNRFRLRFTFWLDMHKPDEAELADIIDTLKQNRSFAATIRDGIRLVADLRAGRTEVLFELFPWVKDTLQTMPAAPAEQGLQQQIARLEALLLAQGNVPIQSPLEASSAPEVVRTGRKSRVKIAATSGKVDATTIAQNFANSMKSFASGFFE